MKELSDFELNKAIYAAIPKNEMRDLRKMLPDYCNNWNDLMPLVIEHSIQLDTSYDNGKHTAYHGKGMMFFQCDFVSHNKNAQRALAECLLKVLESKSES